MFRQGANFRYYFKHNNSMLSTQCSLSSFNLVEACPIIGGIVGMIYGANTEDHFFDKIGGMAIFGTLGYFGGTVVSINPPVILTAISIAGGSCLYDQYQRQKTINDTKKATETK